MRLTDRTGHVYGRLRVISRAPNAGPKDTNARWNCVCECGKMTVAYGGDLARGKVKSCGCLNADRILKHGHCGDPVYKVWQQLRQRCENPKCHAYKNYGARGIKVDPRWGDFAVFLADMGFPPRLATIERIDNGGDYTPTNCRWATMKDQMHNKRNNVNLTHEGKTLSVSAWAEHLGVSRDLINGRLRRGWSVEDTLTRASTPANKDI